MIFLCLFNAAELLSASGFSPCQPTVCFTISWPVKWFIEWLSQYIALERLCPFHMILASLVHCPLDFCDSKLSNLLFKYLHWVLMASTWSSNYFLLLALKSGLSNLNLICSSFLCKALACWSMSIVKVTSRLMPVCWQAFDLAHIWVNPNIRSRSNQAKHPLNCSTCST